MTLLRYGFAVLSGTVTAAAAAQTWTPLGPDGGTVDYLLADPTTPGRLYATAMGLAISDDAGRSWRRAGHGLDGSARNWILGLVADADQAGRLYLVDADGRLMRSDDAGQHWVPAGYSLTIAAAPFGRGRLPMADVPGSTTSLLLVGDDGVLRKSTDSGATFSVLAYFGWTQQPVVTIAVDPANPQHVLAGMGVGSQTISGATLMRSTDGGVTFRTVAGDPGLGVGSSIAFVPGGPILAVLNGRVHVSSDGGASWQSSGVVANYVAVAPNAPHEAVAMSATGCRRSVDFLAGSVPCDAGLPTDGIYARFTDLAVVADGATAFRAVATTSVIGVRALGSADVSWTPSNAGLATRMMRGLELVPGSASVFAGHWEETPFESSALFATEGGGAQWRHVLGDRAKYVRALALDPTTTGQPATMTVYAGGLSLYTPGQATRASLYRSLDGGQSWAVLEQGLPAGSLPGSVQRAMIRQIVVDPRSCATPPARGRCSSGPLQRVFALATTEGWRVLRSDQRGDNWISGDTADSGLPRTFYDGNTFESIYPAHLEIGADGELFLALLYQGGNDDGSPFQPTMQSGVFRSLDGGLHWHQRSNGLPLLPGAAQTYPDVGALAAHPRRAGVLWAAVGNYLQPSRVYKSVDGGASWLPASPLLSDCSIHELQVDRSAPDVIYAAGAGVGYASACIYRSEDGGGTWNAVGPDAPFGTIHDLRWDEHDQARLVVTTEMGVWQLRSPADKIFIENFGD